MTTKITTKKISASALIALKEALIDVYWYKGDLKSFLTICVGDLSILSRLDWTEYKRIVVAQLIEMLTAREDTYQELLIHLMIEVAKIENFGHLAKLDDGQNKVNKAKASVRNLKKQIDGLEHMLQEKKEAQKRRLEFLERQEKYNSVNKTLEQLTSDYMTLIKSQDFQGRGYQLEKILRALFDVFDLDPRASFKIAGEQIDGAFTFENIDYLLEAKWQKDLVRASDLDSLAGKLSRKLDNTLGLYLSINGFSEDGVTAHSSGKRVMFLMDGADLMAVLERRVDLVQLLYRKRRAASQTGNIYLKVQEILIDES
jgi:hypothetical protein